MTDNIMGTDAFPKDFTLTPEQLALMPDGNAVISEAAAFVSALFGSVTDEPERAITMTINILVTIAAFSAIKVRKEILKGDPDPMRWRQATDDAFARALALYKLDQVAPEDVPS